MQKPTAEQVEAMMTEKMGALELASLVRIVKHAHTSAIMGSAKAAFETFES